MKGAESGNGVAVAETKPPAPGLETRELLKRASQGDESCRQAVRALLDDRDRGRDYLDGYRDP